jgi:hypothetical protein
MGKCTTSGGRYGSRGSTPSIGPTSKVSVTRPPPRCAPASDRAAETRFGAQRQRGGSVENHPAVRHRNIFLAELDAPHAARRKQRLVSVSVYSSSTTTPGAMAGNGARSRLPSL